MSLMNTSIRMRLLGSFFTVCFLFIAASMFVKWQNDAVMDKATGIQTEIGPHLSNFSEIKLDIIQIQQWLTDVSATRAAEGYDDGFAEAEKFYQDALKRIDYSCKEHEKYGETEMIEMMGVLRKNLDDYYRVGKEMAETYVKDGPGAGNVMMEKFDPFAAELATRIEGLVQSHKEEQALELEHVVATLERNSFLIVATSIIALALAICITLWLTNSIKGPLTKMSEFVGQLEDGNLLVDCRLNQQDELGQLGKTLKKYSNHHAESITRIKGVSSSMTQSILSLKKLSDKMSSSARVVSDKSRNMAEAVQQMDSNTQSIAAATEQASTNVNMASSAVEEMSATASEIASKADDAIRITKIAVDESASAESSIRELGKAAEDINKVTETITDIADQTNLLALNATIEAARAGEAGKGFAVVANEIKDLARQTTEATRGISLRIEGVQKSTEQTVDVIKNINETIVNTNEIVAAMATGIQEQAEVSKEISSNVSHVSSGIQEVNENIGRMSVTYSDIAREIATIDTDTDQVEVDCSNVADQAIELGSNEAVLSNIVQSYTLAQEPFDIGAVKHSHYEWKMKLSAALSGHAVMESKDVPDHTQCDFGKWYTSVSDELNRYPVSQELNEHHQKVHELVKDVLNLIAGGDNEGANRQLAAFESERRELFRCLDNLYVQASSQTKDLV